MNIIKNNIQSNTSNTSNTNNTNNTSNQIKESKETKLNINLDIYSSHTFLQNFAKHYKLNSSYKDLTELFSEFTNKYIINKPEKIKSYDSNNYDINKPHYTKTFDELKLGNYIKIPYSPYSQKYLDMYNYYSENRFGEIIYINNKNNNDQEQDLLMCNIDTKMNTVYFKSLIVEGCSYLGTSFGYSFFIDLI